MSNSKTLRSIKGKVMRLTALDECGRPDLTNPNSSIVTAGFVSVTWNDEVESGEEYNEKNAWGDPCVAEKDTDRVKWTNIGIEMCEIDPEFMAMVGGAVVNYDGFARAIGTFFTQQPNPLSFAIEVWTKKAGQNQCDTSGLGALEWGYFAGYNVRNGMIDGEAKIENGPLKISMKGELYGASADWGIGPYNDNPLNNAQGVLPGALRYIGVTTVQPPEPTDGVVAIVPAEVAVAGSPGYWSPTPSAPPRDYNYLTVMENPPVASPTTAWSAGQYIVLASGEQVRWNGTNWE